MRGHQCLPLSVLTRLSDGSNGRTSSADSLIEPNQCRWPAEGVLAAATGGPRKNQQTNIRWPTVGSTGGPPMDCQRLVILEVMGVGSSRKKGPFFHILHDRRVGFLASSWCNLEFFSTSFLRRRGPAHSCCISVLFPCCSSTISICVILRSICMSGLLIWSDLVHV